MTDPLILVAGAAITGVTVAALLPRSTLETCLLGPTGARFNRTARQAAMSGIRSVTAKVAAVPIVGPAAANQIEQAIEAVIEPPADAPA